MNKITPILIMIGLMVTGCAEWLDNEDAPQLPDAVTLSHHQLTMLVGDTCKLSAIFSPEDYYEQSLMWKVSADSILNIDANTIVARNVGTANVVVTSVIGLRSDTCLVQVQPAWGDVKTDLHDMVVYAEIDPSIASEDIEVGAFWGNEILGRGVQRTDQGVSYMLFRIYSPVLSCDELEVPVTFRCHLRDQGRVVFFPDTIYFDGETHGSPSNLYKLNLD